MAEVDKDPELQDFYNQPRANNPIVLRRPGVSVRADRLAARFQWRDGDLDLVNEGDEELPATIDDEIASTSRTP